jgi:hypothetical protein
MATVATVAAQSQAAVDADAVDREALPPGTVPWCGLRPTLDNPMIQVFGLTNCIEVKFIEI